MYLILLHCVECILYRYYRLIQIYIDITQLILYNMEALLYNTLLTPFWRPGSIRFIEGLDHFIVLTIQIVLA